MPEVRSSGSMPAVPAVWTLSQVQAQAHSLPPAAPVWASLPTVQPMWPVLQVLQVLPVTVHLITASADLLLQNEHEEIHVAAVKIECSGPLALIVFHTLDDSFKDQAA